MKVVINGVVREFKEDSTIDIVISELKLDGKVMAAAVNMNIVKQNNWGSYKLNDGDKLELLDFVGGG